MPARKTSTPLATLSLQDLLETLNRRQELEDALTRRLGRIQEEVDALRSLVGGTAPAAPRRGRPAKKAAARKKTARKKAPRTKAATKAATKAPASRRAVKTRKGKPTLAENIRSVMKPGESVKASEIMKRLEAAGLHSGAKNFNTMALQALAKQKKLFQRVSRGVYKLKA